MSGIINTHSGREVDALFPYNSLNEIDIGDIAWSLSQQPRFNGHGEPFYSVAQHCVELSFLVHESHEHTALMHDACEAYLGDMASPVKRGLKDYQKLEHLWNQKLSAEFEFAYPFPEPVIQADKCLLTTEMAHFMKRMPSNHDADRYPGYIINIIPRKAETARVMFAMRYAELFG